MTTKELEMLKGVYRSSSSLSEIEIDALRSSIDLIEKQPVTKDGVFVAFGAEVFCPQGHIKSVSDSKSIYCFACAEYYPISECFSALAAAKKEG